MLDTVGSKVRESEFLFDLHSPMKDREIVVQRLHKIMAAREGRGLA